MPTWIDSARSTTNVSSDPDHGDDHVRRLRLIRSLLERADFTLPLDAVDTYADAARSIAEAEIDGIPTETPEAAVRSVVLGTVLIEPLILALRRVAQQVVSWERFAGPDGADVSTPG